MFLFSRWIDLILKAQGHRYLKRIPYMSGGKRRYRYIYKVTHTHRGRQAFDEAHLVEGTAFMLHPEKGAEFHGHITNVSGDQVTYRIDDGARKGEEVTVSKSELLAQLNDVHDIERGVSAERDKVRAQIAQARKTGSEKQVKRLEERLARLGGEQKRAEPEPEPKKKRATRKKKAKSFGTPLSVAGLAEIESVFSDYRRQLKEAERRGLDRYSQEYKNLLFSMTHQNPKATALLEKIDNTLINKVEDRKKIYRGFKRVSRDGLQDRGDRKFHVLSMLGYGGDAETKPILERMAEIHNKEIPPIEVTPLREFTYNLFSPPDLVNDRGIAVAYGSISHPNEKKPLTGIFVVDTKTGKFAHKDTVKTHQVPYILDAYAKNERFQGDLALADGDNASSMRDLVARAGTNSRAEYAGDIAEFVARVLQASEKRR